jgi:hypothetical protein
MYFSVTTTMALSRSAARAKRFLMRMMMSDGTNGRGVGLQKPAAAAVMHD